MTPVLVADAVQTILYSLFADLTALIAAVIGPTYDHLLVPMLQPGALYPPVLGGPTGSNDYLAVAARFSAFMVADVVDPLVTLAGLGVALAFLARATVARWATTLDGLLPRLVIAVVAANFTVPIAAAILDLAGGLYPVIAGWDGGRWQAWVNLAGVGELRLAWDNGALAFVLALAEFLVVFGLLIAVGVRDALLGVLVVVLPLFTLLWPFRPFSSIPRRAWFLFGELAFLPCVLVVPLELAVGSTSPVLLVGFLGAALASPFLLSSTGTHLAAIGFPSAGTTVGAGTQRGIGSAPSAATSAFRPAADSLRRAGGLGRAAGGVTTAAGSAAAPLAAPLALRELLGHAGLALARHVGRRVAFSSGPPRLPPIRPGGPG
jgi:hypothetical protein